MLEKMFWEELIKTEKVAKMEIITFTIMVVIRIKFMENALHSKNVTLRFLGLPLRCHSCYLTES